MKKHIYLLMLLFTTLVNAQTTADYIRVGKKTSNELNAIDRSDTDYIYTGYDTDLDIEVIDIGNGWEPRITGAGMANLVEDISPQLGGGLDGLQNEIFNISNLTLDPNAFGKIVNPYLIAFRPVNGYMAAYSSNNVLGFLLNNVLYIQEVGLNPVRRFHIDFNSLTGPTTLEARDNDILYNGESLLAGNGDMLQATYDGDNDDIVDNSEQLGGVDAADYPTHESDDFVPVLTAATSDNFSYTLDYAIYSKVGRQVSFTIKFSNIQGTSTGRLQITGLPYQASQLTTIGGITTSGGNNGYYSITAQIENDVIGFSHQTSLDSNNVHYYSDVDFGGNYVEISGTYITN